MCINLDEYKLDGIPRKFIKHRIKITVKEFRDNSTGFGISI